MNSPALQALGLTRRFDGGRVRALDGVNLACHAGEVLAIVGPSGCGKSTLLSLLGMLDRPDAGAIRLDGVDYATVRKPHAFRGRHIGFVFQFHHLVATMSLQENVEAALIAGGVAARGRVARAADALASVGLTHRAAHLPAQTSGGERQRAAVARALANAPRLVLADEPTGNLDSVAGRRVMELLVRHAHDASAVVIVATHNGDNAAMADRCVTMRDGRITSDQVLRHAKASEPSDRGGRRAMVSVS